MKLAIIGSYGHLPVVLEGLKQAPDVQLVAAARWGQDDSMGFVGTAAPADLPVHDDYRAMLDEVRPDLAAVFVPFYRLAEAAMAAAESGCQIFMEKPLATTLEDLARLRAAVDRAGVQVAACLTCRGDAAFRTIRQAVLAGRIGRCIYAAAQKSYPFNVRDEFYRTRQTYGGTISWIGIHAIDYIHYCTGQDYRRVAAIASNQAHPSRPGMEDQGGLLLELSGGGAVVINFDYLRPWGKHKRPWGDDRLRIAGTEGIIETKDSASAVELMTPDATETLPLAPAVNIFADFAAALAGGTQPLLTTEESFRATEIALKARQAQDSGRFVEL
ncbi:MAG: hypothetical protein AMJ81_04295 [Phycisphaerae bacterium SM23_33]|nr:MAG: hypothetical protein AMJ81_04295 [Phycisphaerae bacterium SM23_33]